MTADAITLTTDRLLLRPPIEDDLDDYIEIHSHPDVEPFLMGSRRKERSAAWMMLAALVGHWSLRGYGQWTLVDQGSGRVVGRAGFWYPQGGWPDVELGWVLRPADWGRGLATEACRAALRFGFTHLQFPHVISVIRHDNARSIRLAERIGERFEATRQIDGAEHLVYGITGDAQRSGS